MQAELLLEDGQVFMVHLEREHFDRLNIEFRQQVYVKAKEKRAFAFDVADSC